MLWLAGAFSWLFVATAQAAAPALGDIRPHLEKYCYHCHGPRTSEAGVSFSKYQDIKGVLVDRKVWRKTLAQLDQRAMPPDGEPQPSDEERAQLTAWTRAALTSGESTDPKRRNPGPALIRRLNRTEFNYTLRDLLGVDFDVAGAVGMADDTLGESFDNLAVSLTIPPVLMEKYFDAADLVLEKVIPEKGGGPPKVNKNSTPPQKALRAGYESLFAVQPSKTLGEREAAAEIIPKFLRRAYRRPVEPGEVERLLKLYDLAAAEKLPWEGRMRLVVKGVLVSPHFLFRVERDQAAAGSTEAYRVTDHELAVRLSYFLWSSMPDEALFAAADAGKLSDPGQLEVEVRRMLDDPKAAALTDQFAVQWLQLKKLADARPTTEFFPTFTPLLKSYLADEVKLFFHQLRTQDRSVLDLLDCNYTFLNQDLAKHYGIKDITGKELREVQLPAGSDRGGLLGMGAFLALTSHTSRTSPTLRGKYILEVILGAPPPPPPANVGTIEEQKQAGQEPKSFRELLAQHATQTTCAGCHKKIDPLGFGLETYDAVGRWREKANGLPVDATGKLPTGEAFNGPRELKQILLGRRDEFVQNLIEKLMTYALGRDLQYYDDPAVREIQTRLAKSDHRFRELVLGVVQSFPFQQRRNIDAAEE